MKAVKFSNGKFGIRTAWFPSALFKDLKSPTNFEWTMDSEHFGDCQGTKQEVKKRYERLNPSKKPKLTYEIINIDEE